MDTFICLAESASSSNQPANLALGEADESPDTDLMRRINGMYRLVDLYKEHGTVDKILFAKESIVALMKKLAPSSNASLVEINFAPLDHVTILPLGIYGDKGAITQFLRMVAGIDDETAAKLLAPTDSISASGQPKRLALSCGLYFLLPQSNSLTPEPLHTHRSFIIYWPEDTTWDDNAIGTVRRNRTTFMRYLTKLTPQIRSLISKSYADLIVWKGADKEVVVSGTTEQKGAENYPGFEFRHSAITTPTLPPDLTVPVKSSDILRCRLVFGETKQGFLSTRFIPYQKDSNIINMNLNKLGLSGLLARHQNIHLGKDVTEEGLSILMNDSRLQQRADRLMNQWRSDVKTWSDNRDQEIKEGLAQVQTSIAEGRQELTFQVRIRIASVFMSIFPSLEPDRLRGTQPHSTDEVNPDFWNDLFAKHPSALKAETDVVDQKRLSHISCHKYNAVKKRVLEKKNELLNCEGLSEEERNDLFLEIIHDERRNRGIWTKLSKASNTSRTLIGHDRYPPAEPSTTTDCEFMAILDDMARYPHMRPLVEEIYDLIYNWVNRKIEELSPKLVDKVESIQRREMENQNKEQAKFEEKKKKAEGFEVFRNALQKILLPNPDRPCLTVNSIRRGYHSFGQPTYDLIGVVESEKEPCIEYTLFMLELTESDKTHIQEDPRFLPRPEAYGVASFRLSLQDSIRHIQAIGNQILLIVDKPSGVSIWLSERSRIGYDAPVKQFPLSQRQHLFAIHEHRRQLAIAYIEPTGQILLQIQAFDEKFTSIQARGSPQNVTSWYQDGPPDIQHICFAGGPEELCIVEGTGRVRIYSFVSQDFSAATLQFRSGLDVQSVHSAPDDSAMIVVERVPATGYQLRVYHWNSFGQLPEGCILPLPDSIDFRSTTEFCPSSIGERSNAAIIAIMPSQHTMRCINIQNKKISAANSFKSKDDKGTKVLDNTMHNSFIDCHADVWAHYPVGSATKWGQTSSESHQPPPSLTFVCQQDSRLFSTYFKRMIKDLASEKPTEHVLDAVRIWAGSIEVLDWDSLEVGESKAGGWFVKLLYLTPIQIAFAPHNDLVPLIILANGTIDPRQEQRIVGAAVDQMIDSIGLGWYDSIKSYMSMKPVKAVSSKNIKSCTSLEPGTYIIKCVVSSCTLNIYRSEERRNPGICHYRTFKSRSERWLIEQGEEGYRFKNISTGLYISLIPYIKSGDEVLALQHPFEWIVEENEEGIYHVKVASNPQLFLDFGCGDQVLVCDDCHGEPNQQWTFERINDDHLPLRNKQIYIGPVPPGLYWLGQPGEAHEYAHWRNIPPDGVPSIAALGATARLPLGDENQAYAHLAPVADGPWLHQIWALEPGRHGYRLRNVALNAYLNYVDSEPVLESTVSGFLSVTEWSLAKDKEGDPKDRRDYLVRPSADRNVAIGVKKGDLFNQLRVKTLDKWSEERKEGHIYLPWRFEPVQEKFLDTSFSTASAGDLLLQSYV